MACTLRVPGSYQIGVTDHNGGVQPFTFKSHGVQVTGVPVVKSEADKTLVGVLSKKDLSKPGSLVKDVYSSPPIAARPDNKVADAACLMLKHKVAIRVLVSCFQSHLACMGALLQGTAHTEVYCSVCPLAHLEIS